MAQIVMNIAVYLFESLLFFYYCQTAFEERFPKWVSLLTIIGAMAPCCAVCCLWQNMHVNFILGSLALAACVRFLFQQKVLNSLIHAIIYYMMIAFSEFIFIPVFSFVYQTDILGHLDNNVTYFFVIVCGKITHLVLTVITLKIYLTFFAKKNENADGAQRVRGLLWVITVPIAEMIQFSLMEVSFIGRKLSQREMVIWSVSAVTLILSSFIAMYIHSNTVNQAQKISRLTLEKQQRRFDEMYYASVEQSNKEMQILSHDFKNHLVQIESADSLEEVKEYVEKLYPTIRSFRAANISTNKTLNVIISKYNSLSAVKGISFDYEVESDLAGIEANDVSALLNNLLDNALEAAEKSREKQVSLHVFFKNDNTQTIIITNSADTAPVRSGKQLLSTKSQKQAHGFGLQSVQNTVKKYGGFYEWDYDEEKSLFTTVISFFC